MESMAVILAKMLSIASITNSSIVNSFSLAAPSLLACFKITGITAVNSYS